MKKLIILIVAMLFITGCTSNEYDSNINDDFSSPFEKSTHLSQPIPHNQYLRNKQFTLPSLNALPEWANGTEISEPLEYGSYASFDCYNWDVNNESRLILLDDYKLGNDELEAHGLDKYYIELSVLEEADYDLEKLGLEYYPNVLTFDTMVIYFENNPGRNTIRFKPLLSSEETLLDIGYDYSGEYFYLGKGIYYFYADYRSYSDHLYQSNDIYGYLYCEPNDVGMNVYYIEDINKMKTKPVSNLAESSRMWSKPQLSERPEPPIIKNENNEPYIYSFKPSDTFYLERDDYFTEFSDKYTYLPSNVYLNLKDKEITFTYIPTGNEDEKDLDVLNHNLNTLFYGDITKISDDSNIYAVEGSFLPTIENNTKGINNTIDFYLLSDEDLNRIAFILEDMSIEDMESANLKNWHEDNVYIIDYDGFDHPELYDVNLGLKFPEFNIPLVSKDGWYDFKENQSFIN